MKNIAITGLSRSGKDTLAARLVERHGYVRVAFADRLKDAALKADPGIYLGGDDWESLSDLVETLGWETAKDRHPDVRRFLQHYGQTVREIQPTFWIDAAMDDIRSAWASGQPVVVTDVRYLNEARALSLQGFEVVRITRPGQTPGNHASEREMLTYPADHTIVNDGTLEDLAAAADLLDYPQRYVLGMDTP